MQIIGITGGIGSGKSTVAKMFCDLGIPIYYSDIEAKKLMFNSVIIRDALTNRFGNEVYQNNILNRPFLAKLIFTNKENLKFVNSIVHPEVHRHFKEWVTNQKKEKVKYVLQENAILFENGSNVNFDKIITVIAPKDVKINRVKQRDNVTEDQVLDRMNNQWEDEEKIKKSDFVIENVNLSKTKEQVLLVHKQLISQ